MTETKPIEATAGHYQAVMKETLIFDSHGYVKRMTDGGFNEQQAETLAAEQGDLLGNLATGRDIVTVRQDIETVKNDLDEVKKNMATKNDLKNFATKQDLVIVKEDLENMVTNQETAMNKEFELVRKEIQLSAQTLKVEMIKWMTWYFLSGLAVMVAVLKLT